MVKTDNDIYLPSKRVTISLKDLKAKGSQVIEEICRTGTQGDIIEKTVRKQIR